MRLRKPRVLRSACIEGSLDLWKYAGYTFCSILYHRWPCLHLACASALFETIPPTEQGLVSQHRLRLLAIYERVIPL